jgi:hypothetical protein
MDVIIYTISVWSAMRPPSVCNYPVPMFFCK